MFFIKMFKLLLLISMIFAKKNPYRFNNRRELDSVLNRCSQTDKTFRTCTDPNDVHIKYWDVSNIKKLANLFENPNLEHFSVDISRWDISKSDVVIRKPVLK